MVKKKVVSLRTNDLVIIFLAIAGIIITIVIFPVDGIFKTVDRENVDDIDLDLNEQAVEGVTNVVNEADLQSIIDNPITIPESDQNAIEQFLDEVEPIGVTASPKIGIAVDVVLIDSNFQRVNVPTNFLNIPASILPLTLYDERGNIFDLGSVSFAFTAVSNIDKLHDISGKYEIALNGNIITKQEFFGRGIPDEKNKIKLQTTGGKDAVTFIFEDEPQSNFISGESLDNKYEVNIKEVNVIVGDGFDTKTLNYKGSFNAHTLRLQFDKDKTVIRDNTGKAISVFVSDSTITECVQNKGVINNLIGTTDVGYSVARKQVQIYKDITSNPIVTSKPPTFTNKEAEIFAFKCGNPVGGIPRNSDLIFRVGGEDIKITTKKTQENFIISCKQDFGTSPPVPHPPKCTSNFGFGGIYQP